MKGEYPSSSADEGCGSCCQREAFRLSKDSKPGARKSAATGNSGNCSICACDRWREQ